VTGGRPVIPSPRDVSHESKPFALASRRPVRLHGSWVSHLAIHTARPSLLSYELTRIVAFHDTYWSRRATIDSTLLQTMETQSIDRHVVSMYELGKHWR
jgi:hypothetical protein